MPDAGLVETCENAAVRGEFPFLYLPGPQGETGEDAGFVIREPDAQFARELFLLGKLGAEGLAVQLACRDLVFPSAVEGQVLRNVGHAEVFRKIDP